MLLFVKHIFFNYNFKRPSTKMYPHKNIDPRNGLNNESSSDDE